MGNTLWIRLPVHEQRLQAEEYGPIETEFTSRGNSLTGLEAAISHVKETNSRLIIGKIGSLIRSHVVLGMLQGLEFICCDKPYLNNQTLHVDLEKARFFSRTVSRETKKGLVGKVLGFARPGAKPSKSQPKAVKKAAKLRTANARRLYQMLPFAELRAKGLTYEEIAVKLNEMGHMTTIGPPFNGPTVQRIMQRSPSA